MSITGIHEKIFLHTAKITINKDAFIFKPEIINLVKVGNVVRISFEVECELPVWNHDSPYVKIIKVDGEALLGEIQDINRISRTNKYPLNIGDQIWFKKNNIIEVPIELNSNTQFKGLLTSDRVTANGPLYTIESDYESESGSEHDSEPNDDSYSESCSDSD